MPLRAGRKNAAPFPLHFSKFVKIVSPAARENSDLGTEFPGWNRRAAVVEWRACALSVAGGEVTTKVSGHFCARRAKAAGSFRDIRSTSDSEQPMRRNERVLAPLAIRPRRRQPLAA